MDFSSEIKNDLVNKKYNKKCQITWVISKKVHSNTNNNDNIYNNDNNDLASKCSRISHRNSNYNFF